MFSRYKALPLGRGASLELITILSLYIIARIFVNPLPLQEDKNHSGPLVTFFDSIPVPRYNGFRIHFHQRYVSTTPSRGHLGDGNIMSRKSTVLSKRLWLIHIAPCLGSTLRTRELREVHTVRRAAGIHYFRELDVMQFCDEY